MRIKTLAVAATAAALVAAPLQANPASALSLSADVRAGEAVEGESNLFAGTIGTLLSIAGGLLSAYLVYELIDDEAVSA